MVKMNDKRFIKTRVVAAIFCIVALFCATVPLTARAATVDDADKARAFCIYNVENDTVICEKDADVPVAATATARLAAALICTEYFESRLDETVNIEKAMLPESRELCIGLVAGNTPTVRDLLYLAYCGGYLDASAALAYVIEKESGSSLTNMMNARAQTLGMTGTHFTNAQGTYDEEMVTTVGDTLKLALFCRGNSLLVSVTSAGSNSEYRTEGLASHIGCANRNLLLTVLRSPTKYYNKNCSGLASASPTEGGESVITLARSGAMNYVCIVLGGDAGSDGERYAYKLANALIDTAATTWGYVVLFSETDVICELPVKVSADGEAVLVVPRTSSSTFLPLDTEIGSDVVLTSRLDVEELEAPVAAGTVVGTLTATRNGEVIASVELVTKTSAARDELAYAMSRIRDFTQSRVFRATIVSAAIITAVYLIANSAVRSSRKRKRKTYR